jgi:hypothetical protein
MGKTRQLRLQSEMRRKQGREWATGRGAGGEKMKSQNTYPRWTRESAASDPCGGEPWWFSASAEKWRASGFVCRVSAEMGYSVANVSEGYLQIEEVKVKVVVGVLFRRETFWDGGSPFKWEGEAKFGALFWERSLRFGVRMLEDLGLDFYKKK